MNAPELVLPEGVEKPRPRLTPRGKLFGLINLAVLARIAGITGQPQRFPYPRRRGKFKPRTRSQR